MKLKKYLEYREIFESNYKKKIQENKHDLEYVNLYDLKTGISRYKEFLFIYSTDIRPCFSNTVNSIDRRQRFRVKLGDIYNFPAIKIIIDFEHAYLVDNWPEHFEKVNNYYKNNKK